MHSSRTGDKVPWFLGDGDGKEESMVHGVEILAISLREKQYLAKQTLFA